MDTTGTLYVSTAFNDPTIKTTIYAMSTSGRIIRQKTLSQYVVGLTWDTAKSNLIALVSNKIESGQEFVLSLWRVDPKKFTASQIGAFEPIFARGSGEAFDPKTRIFYIHLNLNFRFTVVGINVDTGLHLSNAPLPDYAPIMSLDVDTATSTLNAMWFNASGTNFGYNLASMDPITGKLTARGGYFLSRIEVPAFTAINAALRQYLVYSVQGGDGIRNEFHILNLDSGQELLGFRVSWWSNLVTFNWTPDLLVNS